MDSWQVLNDPYSVRDFDSTVDVSESTIDRLLAAAIHTPSAGNRQPWHLASAQNTLSVAAYDQAFLGDALVTIVVCAVPEQSAARYGNRGRELYCLHDTAAAVQNMLLASVASGLGACWLGAFDQEKAAIALNLPTEQRPIAIVPLGTPVARGPVSRTQRRQIRNLVTKVA